MSAAPLEIEAKLKVDSFDPVRAALRAAGARHIGRVMELNRFFDRPDAELRRRGCGLRIREATALEGPPRSATLTYKGPQQAGPFKRREEREVEIGDPSALAAILERLGFVELISFEKRRESWELGGCHVELDELPKLGLFVEIEGPNEAVVKQMQTELGLAANPPIREPYLALLTGGQPVTAGHAFRF